MFEISIGNAGNTTDGFVPLETYADLSALDDSDGINYKMDLVNQSNNFFTLLDTCMQATWRSTTSPQFCQTWDKNNYFLHFGDEKPTLFVR